MTPSAPWCAVPEPRRTGAVLTARAFHSNRRRLRAMPICHRLCARKIPNARVIVRKPVVLAYLATALHMPDAVAGCGAEGGVRGWSVSAFGEFEFAEVESCHGALVDGSVVGSAFDGFTDVVGFRQWRARFSRCVTAFRVKHERGLAVVLVRECSVFVDRQQPVRACRLVHSPNDDTTLGLDANGLAFACVQGC